MKITLENQMDQTEIDWSKEGQLVVCKKSGVYVITDGKRSLGHFSGTRLNNGFHAATWVQDEFELVQGKVTIEND